MTTRVLLVSTHRSDRGHYARLITVLREACDVAAWDGRPGDKLRADVGVVLGDRYEMMLAAAQIVEARIPLVHIHGGEHTYGSLDERWRWAMTMLADVHCVATREACEDICDTFYPPGIGPRSDYAYVHLPKVHVTGAPGLDGIRDTPTTPNMPAVLVLYNPAIDDPTTRAERESIAAGVGRANVPFAWIVSNGDRFHEIIDDFMMWPTAEPEVFRSYLKSTHVIVGNSSAGIIEAPSLGTWCVNVGERQAGRERADNVTDVPADPAAIRAAIEDALGRPRYDGPNPYENPEGRACEAIRDVLLGMVRT